MELTFFVGLNVWKRWDQVENSQFMVKQVLHAYLYNFNWNEQGGFQLTIMIMRTYFDDVRKRIRNLFYIFQA